MDKNEELQKWLNDDRYVQRKELEKLWHISKTGVCNTLREKKIKPTKKIYMGRIGNYTFFNKKECECARPFKSKIEELHDWIDSDIYVQTKELASMWGISMTGTSHFLRTKKIHPVKTFRFGIDGGKYVFYDRAECISARTSLYENEELVKLINDDSCVQTHKLSEAWDMATTTVSACLRSDNIKPKKIINLGGGGGRFVFYDKKECESSILKQKNIREELQKWLNDDKYVRTTTLSETWGCTISSVSTLLRKYKIQPTKTIHAGRNGVFSFYDKAKCMSAKNDASGRKDELRSWLDDKNYIRPEELKDILGLNSSAVTYFLRKRNIKPVKRFFSGNRGGSFVFYDRAVCMNVNSDCNTFINQPEKEVEKVERVNLPEAELDSEELATENGKALNDNELAAIIDACKDPIDKTMILSALCFGIRTGELDSLNLRDISGAEICLQSPSGVVKMRIPKQYEDARTELITYYVDNGNSLSGDMPVFLNRSGVRMTRQGLNNRMKSVSESANIGRDVKLADLRATFAQNIYKKTEKNIASVHKYLRLSGNTNIMGYLLETQTKDQKAMPVDLMNSLTASYQVKEPLSIAEPREQTPDIIPADTIDLFTMSELETELKNRGVELTTEVKAKINASDMPEMQEIATMIRGNSKTIAIRLSVLNDIAGQLRSYNTLEEEEPTNNHKIANADNARKMSKWERSWLDLWEKVDAEIDAEESTEEIKEIKKVLARHGSPTARVCKDMLQKHGYIGFMEAGYLLKMNYYTLQRYAQTFTPDIVATMGYSPSMGYENGKSTSFFWKRERVLTHADELNQTKEDKKIAEQIQPKMYENMAHMKFDWHMSLITDNHKLRLIKMAECDRLTLSLKIEQIIDAAWIMGNYDNK